MNYLTVIAILAKNAPPSLAFTLFVCLAILLAVVALVKPPAGTACLAVAVILLAATLLAPW